MPDFTDLISQAKKMQEKMKETQEALKKIEVEGVSGGNAVKIIMNGEGELKKITWVDRKKMGHYFNKEIGPKDFFRTSVW